MPNEAIKLEEVARPNTLSHNTEKHRSENIG